MSVIFLVVPLATIIVLAAVIAFVWSARRGQFDDLDTPAVRMLHDDPEASGSADERTPP
jgi:cbb3-type cytochrome oxidase maturation protein